MQEILPTPYTQPFGRTPQHRTGLLSRHRSVSPHPSVTPSDPQTFPILPEQLEKHLEQTQRHLIHNLPVQAAPISGSAPSPSSNQILVLNPPAGIVSTVYAFHASTLGMPSMVDYLRFFTRYLDEMSPSKRGKALIDSELLRRIKLILSLQRKDFSGSDETSSGSDSPSSYGTEGSWDTQAFRRWARNTFVYRQATQAELELAIDFGLLSPPESSLSGPGIPGHAPSSGFSRSMNLVFHRDRPVALRSRIYKVILRAHWITNHAGRDRTWAMVREVCSYIPKCLVYDFVAACPTCRVARSKQYEVYRGIPRGVPAADMEKLLKLGEKPQQKFQTKVDRDDPRAEDRFPPILPILFQDTPPVGWIPEIGADDPTLMPTHPLWHLHRHHETNAQTVTDLISDLPIGPLKLSPLPNLLPPAPSAPGRAVDRSQQPSPQSQDLQGAQQETPAPECVFPSWAVISKLIEAKSEQAEDVSALTGSPALKRRDGPSTPESIEPTGVNCGREATASIFPTVAPW